MRRTPGAGGAPAAALAIGLCVMSGCATGGTQQVQTDLDGMQQQLWKIQKDHAALTEQIGALRAETSRASTETPAAAIGAADLKLRLDGLDRDLSVLRSRTDDSDQRYEALARDLRLLRETVETLGRSVAAGAAPAPGAASAPGATSAPAPSGAAGAVAGDRAGSAAAGPQGVEEIYRQASLDETRGNNDAALKGLQEVLRLSPKGDLADDAQFLIGEIHYGAQRYAEAVAAFEALLTNFPGSDKAAAAHLKKGLALLELNRTADAVIQFQHVVSRYPKSEEARIARERLRALGLKDR